MLIPRRHLALLVFLIQAVTALAQTDTFPSPEAAIASLFPRDEYVEWTSTGGDWNGDGIEDRAIILTQRPVDGPTQIRLVVLAGVAGGSYFALSASCSYCSAQKLYDLTSEGTSLRVTAVHSMDGPVTETHHFRFSKKVGDFELIGWDNVYGSALDKSYGHRSINYLTGWASVYEKERGRIKKKRSRFAVEQLAKLNGFDCDK